MLKYLPAAAVMIVVGAAGSLLPASFRPVVGGFSVLAFALMLFPLVRKNPRGPHGSMLRAYLMPDGRGVSFARYLIVSLCLALMTSVVGGWMIAAAR